MRMFPYLPHSLEQLEFLSGLIIGPGSNYALFVYSDEDRVEKISRVHQATPTGSHHPPGAKPTHGK